MSVFRHFERNLAGRDFAVGDIHGHFTRLQAALDAAGFVAESDRLFSVGDLVDRGPESIRALEWLDRPWFFAIQGNHEDMAVRHAFEHRLDPDVYCSNGGAWLMALPDCEQRRVAARLGSLPLLAEIDTEYGLVGPGSRGLSVGVVGRSVRRDGEPGCATATQGEIESRLPVVARADLCRG
ncbi:Serine/threonine-protein phosphatase 2 [compost metagenome]